MKKILNQKGSVLQIVLVIFFVLSISIMSMATVVLNNARTNLNIQELDKYRLLEVLLLGYYKYEIVNGLLISDEIQVGESTIYYTVDDMATYYQINTTISDNNSSYSFIVDIDLDKNLVTKFEYQ